MRALHGHVHNRLNMKRRTSDIRISCAHSMHSWWLLYRFPSKCGLILVKHIGFLDGLWHPATEKNQTETKSPKQQQRQWELEETHSASVTQSQHITHIQKENENRIVRPTRGRLENLCVGTSKSFSDRNKYILNVTQKSHQWAQQHPGTPRRPREIQWSRNILCIAGNTHARASAHW